jgi:hypothetical protein
MKRVLTSLAAASLMLSVFAGAASAAAPAKGAAPARETFFICPTVSLNNARGNWVIGAHGAYYVIVPLQGTNAPAPNGDHKVYVTVPAQVFDKAQIPAGFGLYKDLPTYPNYETNSVEKPAMLLSEGVDTWLGGAAGFMEGDVVAVTNNGDGTSTVTVVMSMMHPGDIGNSLRISGSIPLASGAIW